MTVRKIESPDLSTAKSGMLTRMLLPTMESAVDPMCDQVTFVAWRMTGASPRAIRNDSDAHYAGGVFDELVETVWSPGRITISCEIAAFTDDSPEGLTLTLLVGVLGSHGATEFEATSVQQVFGAIASRPSFPYSVEAFDPACYLSPPEEETAHSALIRQRMVSMEIGKTELEVLSRWNPTVAPWSSVARLLMERRQPTRVRATVLATELSIDDRQNLEETLGIVHSLTESGITHPDQRFQLERASATLVDLKASFRSPLLAVELAVTSSDPLADSTLRAIGSAFTSEGDVLRRQGHIVVASQRMLLGGFEIQRDPPRLADALRQGLPLSGGVGRRSLRDVITLTENPIGWAIAAGAPIPTIPTAVSRLRPIPPELRTGLLVGTGRDGADVCVPLTEVLRHALLVGGTGSGKSAEFCLRCLDDLRSGRPFMTWDPHGLLAHHLIAVARAEGLELYWLDVTYPGSSRYSPIPLLLPGGTNMSEVALSVDRFADAVASSLPNPEWAGVRWREQMVAIGFISAIFGLHVAEAVDWYADVRKRRAAIEHPDMPDSVRRTLRLLHAMREGEGAELIGWVISKVDPIVTGLAAQLLAPPGEGITMRELMQGSKSLVCNLAGLGATGTRLMGHLLLSDSLETSLDLMGTVESSLGYVLYVDEAPLFHAKSIDRVMAEGRKAGAALWLAAQSPAQLTAAGFSDTVFSASVKMAFRQTPEGAAQLAHMLDVPAHELIDQADFHAFIRVGRYETTSMRVPSYEPLPVVEDPAPELPESPLQVSNPMTDHKRARLSPPTSDWLDAWLQARGDGGDPGWSARDAG